MNDKNTIEIQEVKENKKLFLDLLLLGDEQESMIDCYLEKGTLYVLSIADLVVGVCVVIEVEKQVLEVKNIAITPSHQRLGYGRLLLEYVIEKCAESYTHILVGTGGTPSTINFYSSCGFTYSHRIENFFIDNYDHPIVEDGITLKDMIYFVFHR